MRDQVSHPYQTVAYVTPLVWETKFHTHTKQKTKLNFLTVCKIKPFKILYLLTVSSDQLQFQMIEEWPTCSSSVHTVIWDLSDFKLNFHFLLHFVLFLFLLLLLLLLLCCVLTVVQHWEQCCDFCFFVYVVTLMVYVFNLVHVVTFVYNGDSWVRWRQLLLLWKSSTFKYLTFRGPRIMYILIIKPMRCPSISILFLDQEGMHSSLILLANSQLNLYVLLYVQC